jgi:hypothetical protein
MNSGKVKCTCGWSWNKSDSSKKDMYICHECGRDNSNNMKNGGALDKAQTGKKLPKETEADRAKRVAEKTAGALGIGLVLDQYPGAETVYDGWNIIDAYNEGDPMKIMPNVFGALLPGISGKAIEAVTEEYLPKTPEKEKEKFKAVMKGKRASFEEMRKVQESIDWSKGWDKMKSDIKSLFIEPPTIDKQKVIKYFNSKPKNRLENGGWLDNYADGGSMQEHQENYNDSQAFAPEGMVGDGFSNVGRNYSPAWGGQFQKGGKLKFLQPTDKNLPEGYRIPYDTPSSERAMSIGGENGEPAYLIPSFKYGKELDDPLGEFRKTGEHLGGPFKTWQEAEEWERTVRHPAVEKGENIMFPQEQFQNGGKKKPIYVESKKDPRYKAYNDSLSLYKKTLEIENPKYYIKENGRQSDPSWYNWKGDRLAAEEFGRKNNIDYGYEYYQTGKFPGKIQPIRTGDWGEGMAYPIYKKPQQPVLIETKAIQNNLHPTGSTNNLNINSSIPTIRHKAKNAKSYKVKETVQGKYAPSTVEYEVTDPRNINMNDLGPGNTRVLTPNYAMGGSIPGAVGFTYARTKGIPSNGPYAKKTLASAQNGVDMYENPMLARRVDNPNVNRSYYDPRLNTMNIGTDYNTWKDEYTGELLTGDDLKYHQDKLLAHENYHAVQHSQGRDNYDIAHNTDNAQWAQMQKRPEVMSTNAVWNNFYNRSDFENQQDYQEMINSYPESRILNPNLLFDKVLDRQRYDNPANLEGEAKFYEDTGVDLSKQSQFSLNPTEFQNGGEMRYYQNGLDWKPKSISRDGSVIKDDRGQWAHPGEITEIGSNNITMQGVPYDVLGISDEGDVQYMKANNPKNYKYKGKKVTEFPMAKNGVNQQDEKTFEHLNQLTNFTNYNKPQPGGWLNKYN